MSHFFSDFPRETAPKCRISCIFCHAGFKIPNRSYPQERKRTVDILSSSLASSNGAQRTHLDLVRTIDDPRLDVYARLTDAQLRNKLEPERGVLIAESSKVIGRALDAGLQAVSLLVSERHVQKEAELIARFERENPEAPVLVGPSELLEQLTGFELTRGALAAFRRPALPDARDLLSSARRVAVLEDITNHTNIGAIFRSAAALGLDAVFVTPGCYDPFYRRAVRVSMGTVFQIPWTHLGADVEEAHAHGNVARAGGWTRTGMPLLHEMGFEVAAMALDERAVSLDDPRLNAAERLAIVLGTEGEGLSPVTIEAADHTVRIPMHHGVDSLNVAAASAVAFWQLRIR